MNGIIKKALLIVIVLFSWKGAFCADFTLPSGRVLKKPGIMRMMFKDGNTALILNYQTSVDIDNTDDLRKEAEEIWPFFRVNVEKAGFRFAIIKASFPILNLGLYKKTKSYSFVTEKKSNDIWYFKDWGMNYEDVPKKKSELFLINLRDKKINNMVKFLHYPANFTEKQLKDEMESLSKTFGILLSELGTIKKFSLNKSGKKYAYIGIQTSDFEYWNKYPYFNSIVYDVEFLKAGPGFIEIRFSIIENKMVINSVLYGLSLENPSNVRLLKELQPKLVD